MSFPTNVYTPRTVEATVTWSTPGGASPYQETLRFTLQYGGVGVTEACYEQAVTDAVDAFTNALDVEATINGVAYRYLGDA